MINIKYSKSLFPKVSTSLSLILVLVIILSLSYGLYRAQKDVRRINDIHVPLVEYSSSLLKINTDLIRLVSKIKESSNDNLQIIKTNIARRKSILNEVISSTNELLRELNQMEIDRSEVNKIEEILLSSSKDFDFSFYEKKAMLFSEETSNTVEHILDNRDYFVEELIKRNIGIFIISFLMLIIWLTLFIRLILALRSNIKDKDNLMVDLYNAKDDIEGLVRVISHDVATPLSVIFAYSGLDLKEGDSKDNIKRMDAIKLCAKNIGEMLTHIKDMQAIKDGKVDLNLEEIDIEEVLNDLVSLFDKRLSEKSIKLNININLEPNTTILADRTTLLNQVLSNILSNAIKFSDHDSKIDVNVTQDNKSGTVGITIRDYGIGMPRSISDNIFSTKEKTSRPGLDGEKGTGFGIPIVKLYMERFNGSVNVASRCIQEYPDSPGTTFILVFDQSPPE